MKVLVTGAEGFVGRWMVDALVGAGHEVLGTHLQATPPPNNDRWGRRAPAQWHRLDLAEDTPHPEVTSATVDAVIHLAAVSSVSEASSSPARAWEINLIGTARLLGAIAVHGSPRVLIVSTGEVYGRGIGTNSRSEADPTAPRSVYAASKVGAEMVAFDLWERMGLPVIVARPFPHTGPGQDSRFVVPAFTSRLAEAARSGAETVPTGNLDPIRDLLDVRDVVRAYLGLLTEGEPGEVYNVARGEGVSLRDLFAMIAGIAKTTAAPVIDPLLARPSDIPHLVGNAAKLRERTDWSPSIDLLHTLQEMAHAETD